MRRTPTLERIFAEARTSTDKRPIILIPGILNSALVNSKTGEVVWPSAFRSSNDELGLPITADPLTSSDDLVATKIIDSARFIPLFPKINIFRELLEALHKYGGYREGDWDDPGPNGDRDTFYVFAYDWRRDNARTAIEFVRRVESLKRKLQRPDLRFNIVAVSMGGLVARYAAMYGDVDLPLENMLPRPNWAGAAHINKMFMFGVPNEGSAEAFATLLNGYSITEGLNRRVRLLNKLSREDALAGLSVFQLLPHSDAVHFLDGDLKPLPIDLYDPAVWKLYGWSAVHDPDYRRRFINGSAQGGKSSPKHRSPTELDAHLAAALLRAKLFHQALDAPFEGQPPVTIFAFGGDCEETLHAPVILRDERNNRWITLTSPRELRGSDGRRISRREVMHAMYAPGDGRVTRCSMLAESHARLNKRLFYNTVLPIAYAYFACDTHGNLHNNKALQDNALTVLLNEATR
ncbi:MAG TPA: hypothetical protein VD966_03855 [Pyrinomonadaceae bacterium]|nr:hypothetical protein [Pyrinomonadaceae bacterium]